MTRAQNAARASELRVEGLVFREIAGRMGISVSYAQQLVADPDGSKCQARKDSYRKPCPQCGRLMNGSDGTNGPRLCTRCDKVDQKTNMARRELHRKGGTGPRVWTDQRMLDAIRSIAQDGIASLGEYNAAYARTRKGSMPSTVLFVQRFGSWSEAVRRAGLRTIRNSRGPYSTRLTTEGAILAVEECAHEYGRMPTTREYEAWAKRVGAPSGGLIRLRFGGSWMEAVNACEEAA